MRHLPFPDTNNQAHLRLLYIGAVALVIAFGALQWHLMQNYGLRMTYLMFFPPIMISAWYGGWRVGLLASATSTLVVVNFFLDPAFKLSSINATQMWTTLIFFVECLFITALGEARLQSRRALINERNLLEQRVIERTSEMAVANEQLAAQIVKREEVQMALSESESKFRSVVETASDAIVMSDVAGNIVFWNRGAQKMFGYEAAEVLHKPVVQLIPSQFQEAHERAMQRLQEGAAPRLMGQSLELRGLRKDGREFPLELSLAGWQIGNQQFYSGIMRDLTQRKQAEEDRMRLIEEMTTRAELEAAEQHYRSLAEAIPQMVWTALPDGSVDYFNQQWFVYTGLDPGHASGWAWQNVLHPDDRPRTLELWQQCIKNGSDYEIECRFRRHDGAYHWHLVRAVPLRDDAGRIYKWFGTCTDIEAQKNTEETSRFLAQAMGRLTASLNETAIVHTLADLCAPALGQASMVHLVRNIEAEPSLYHKDFLSYAMALERVALAGKQAQKERANDESNPCYEAPDSSPPSGPWRALETRRTEILPLSEIEALTQEGALLEAWRTELFNQAQEDSFTILCVPLIARGHILGVLTILGTDPIHRLAEADIGLIEEVARNAALMIDNARLLHETREANRAKDEFLAVLSHELRTPLTAILGWVQLLKGTSLDEDTHQRALDTIERNTNAQTQLIGDLLDLSRIVTGKLRLELQPLDVQPVIEAALDAVRPAAQAKEITLCVAFSPGIGVVMGDAHRLQQVFWNLLSNAVKFTDRGGRIEVTMQRLEPYVEISVADNGRGISADFLPYVFDRFRQADSSSTRQHGGLGLGLAIVRHVTELHGGTVQALSDGENKGTTFKILLPLSPLVSSVATLSGLHDTESTEVKIGEATPPLNSFQVLEGVRVLLVDDEQDTREMLSAALRRYGAQVQSCAAAREALTALPHWQPDVLVSDIGMPEEDGYDLIQQVRSLADQQGGAVPAIALTAYARISDRERALQAGFNQHIVKPVDPATLASLVAALARQNNRIG